MWATATGQDLLFKKEVHVSEDSISNTSILPKLIYKLNEIPIITTPLPIFQIKIQGGTVKKMNSQAPGWEKIPRKQVFDQRPVSRVYKEHPLLHSNMMNSPVFLKTRSIWADASQKHKWLSTGGRKTTQLHQIWRIKTTDTTKHWWQCGATGMSIHEYGIKSLNQFGSF